VDREEGVAPLEGTSFHAVAGGGVLYNAAKGHLYAVNPAAGVVWLCLSDGFSNPEITSTVAKTFKIDSIVAAEWLRNSLEMFQRMGLLGKSEAAETTPEQVEEKIESSAFSEKQPSGQGLDYELLDTTFRLRAPPSIRNLIDSLIGNFLLPPSKNAHPSIHIEIVPSGDEWVIVKDGQFTTRCETASVAAELEQILVQTIVPAIPHLMTLHAAALQRAGRIFLLAGSSGVGKTTLSAALTRAGWNFACDEIVLLGRNLSLRALPLPPCIKTDSFSLVEKWFPELRETPEHNRLGGTVKYLPIESTPLEGGPIDIIFPSRTVDQENQIQRLDCFEGLQRLLEQCIYIPSGLVRGDVERLLQWHSKRRYFQLNYNDCSAAVTLLSKC
jgi:hypothetical protein